MARLNMAPPWIEFYEEVKTMFEKDPEIFILYDEDQNLIKLFVDSQKKATALTKLLPEQKEFGNVVLTIEIIPSNGLFGNPQVVDYKDAFKGNGAVAGIETIESSMGFSATYIIFEKEVVQYYNDNLQSIYGLKSTLYETIAKNVFEQISGVFFCTANNHSLF